MHLPSGVGADRDLQVPAVVGSAGTPPEGDAAGRKAQVLSIEVLGHQMVGLGLADGAESGQVGEVEAGVGIVLALDLKVPGHAFSFGRARKGRY